MTGRRIPLNSRALVLTIVGILVAIMVAVTVAVAATGTDPSPAPTGAGAGGTGSGGDGGNGSGGGSGNGGGNGGSGNGSGSGSTPGGGSGRADSTVRFTSFNYTAEVDCRAANGQKAPLALSWSSANAVAAYWRAGDTDPKSANADNGYLVPVSGNQGNLTVGGEPRGVFQECNHREFYYVVITLVGKDGTTTSQTATFRDISWGTSGGPDEDPGLESPAQIRSFTGPSNSGCLSPQAPAYQATVNVTFSWEVVNADEVAFGIATTDALNRPYADGLDWVGSIAVTFGCAMASQTYTLTIAGADGDHVSRTLTVTNPAYEP